MAFSGVRHICWNSLQQEVEIQSSADGQTDLHKHMSTSVNSNIPQLPLEKLRKEHDHIDSMYMRGPFSLTPMPFLIKNKQTYI